MIASNYYSLYPVLIRARFPFLSCHFPLQTLTTTSLTTSTSETPTTTFTRSTTTCPGFLFNPASIPVIAQGGNAQHEIYRVSTVDGIDRAFYGGKAAGGNFTFVTETVYPGTTEAAVIFAVERVGTFKWMKGSISGVANGVQDGTGGNAVKGGFNGSRDRKPS